MVTAKGKAEKLHGLASWLGIKPDQCVAVGDGANDIHMMNVAGLSIAFNGRRKVRERASVSIRGNDLRMILPFIKEFADLESPIDRELLVNQI